MAALTSVAITTTGATPSAVAANSSDTIADGQFGATGVILRVINAGGTQDSVTISDPTLTGLGNAGTPTAVVVPITTGVRLIFIPRTAVNQGTGVATVNHSFTTSVTQELFRL